MMVNKFFSDDGDDDDNPFPPLSPPPPHLIQVIQLSNSFFFLVHIYHLRITLQPRLSICLFLLPYMCPPLVGYLATKPLLLCLFPSVSTLWFLLYVCLHFAQGVQQPDIFNCLFFPESLLSVFPYSSPLDNIVTLVFL